MRNKFSKSSVRQLTLPVLLAGCIALAPAVLAHEESEGGVFPTSVIADYVLGCMSANGNSFEALHQCSCSIDFIKQRMTYEEYEQAQTIMQVRRDRGQRGIFFRDAAWAKKRAEKLEKLQAESTLRCF